MTTPSVTADLNESAQVTLQGGGSGSLASPLSGNVIVGRIFVAPGNYTVNWTVTLAGTLSSQDANNFELVLGQGGQGRVIAQSVNPAVAGSYPQTPIALTDVPLNSWLEIAVSPNNGTAGSTYSGSIASPGWGIASLSPFGTRYSGYTWQPSMLNVSVAPLPGQSAALSEATATSFVSYGVKSAQPTDQIAQTVYGSSGDTCGMTQTLRPNDYVSVLWMGGDVGAIATMRLTGSVNIPLPSATKQT